MQARLKRETYGIEGEDWGVAQTAEIFTKKPHAPTPRLHALAKTVTTRALHELIIGDESPLLIDVMGGNIGPRSVGQAAGGGQAVSAGTGLAQWAPSGSVRQTWGDSRKYNQRP